MSKSRNYISSIPPSIQKDCETIYGIISHYNLSYTHSLPSDIWHYCLVLTIQHDNHEWEEYEAVWSSELNPEGYLTQQAAADALGVKLGDGAVGVKDARAKFEVENERGRVGLFDEDVAGLGVEETGRRKIEMNSRRLQRKRLVKKGREWVYAKFDAFKHFLTRARR